MTTRKGQRVGVGGEGRKREGKRERKKERERKREKEKDMSSGLDRGREER
jgi:hypothetical protein